MAKHDQMQTLLSRRFETMDFIGSDDRWWEMDDGRELYMTPGGSFEIFSAPDEEDKDDRMILDEQLEADELLALIRKR